MQQGLVGPFVYIQNGEPIVVEMWSIVCKIQLDIIFNSIISGVLWPNLVYTSIGLSGSKKRVTIFFHIHIQLQHILIKDLFGTRHIFNTKTS
jgi:hypothetical protein